MLSTSRVWGRYRFVGVAFAWQVISGCTSSGTASVPTFVGDLPDLGAASSAYGGAMRDFTRDLEAWSARAGRPASAEALIGPMFLRSSPLHAIPAASDTGVEADYQRLDVRFAHLQERGDSLRRASVAAREQVLAWLGRAGTPVADSVASFRAPIYPPQPADSGRGAAARMVKCALITVSVLPSKEGVRVCVLKEKQCTRMPADAIGDAWWAVRCLQSCFDYIGWVPSRGGFTIGAS